MVRAQIKKKQEYRLIQSGMTSRPRLEENPMHMTTSTAPIRPLINSGIFWRGHKHSLHSQKLQKEKKKKKRKTDQSPPKCKGERQHQYSAKGDGTHHRVHAPVGLAVDTIWVVKLNN